MIQIENYSLLNSHLKYLSVVDSHIHILNLNNLLLELHNIFDIKNTNLHNKMNNLVMLKLNTYTHTKVSKTFELRCQLVIFKRKN